MAELDNGNMAAMREALVDIVLLTVKAGKSLSCDVACGIIASKAKHAIAKAPRNCDVGTAKEQETRFKRFCDSHWDLNNSDDNCAKCLINKIRAGGECEFAWMQMPYEGKGANQ